MTTYLVTDLNPATRRKMNDRAVARSYYLDADTPEEHTTLANSWLADNNTTKLPNSHHAVLLEYGMKRCPSCESVKLLENFSPLKRGGINYQCKPCASSRYRAYAAQDPEATKKRSQTNSATYRARHPWQDKLQGGLQRAIKRGAPAVKVTEAELLDYWASKGIDPNVSAYSGTPLTNENRSLDHLDPLEREGSLGHCAQNLFPCTKQENFSKKASHPVRAVAKIRRENNNNG